ncbi:uncharacterized protein [Palaemon carinicauda]|uniref:uncharacterized protein n=1 Tax=Palaemon carinicauda TaxID=392227 RepID=UPI0035B62DEB
MRILLAFLVFFLDHQPIACVSNSSCLDYLACYNELFMDYTKFEIYFEDLDVRAADTCGDLCQKLRPQASLVMVKMIAMNERLVCGCGDNESLGNYSGIVDDSQLCDGCPDGSQQCGGASTVSVYRLVLGAEDCNQESYDVPSLTLPATTVRPTGNPRVLVTTSAIGLTHVGCYDEDSVSQSLVAYHYMVWPQTSVEECFAICNSSSLTSIIALKLLNENQLLCGCGSRDTLGEPLAETDCSQGSATNKKCQFNCPANTYSVYSVASRNINPLFNVILFFVMSSGWYWIAI